MVNRNAGPKSARRAGNSDGAADAVDAPTSSEQVCGNTLSKLGTKVVFSGLLVGWLLRALLSGWVANRDA